MLQRRLILTKTQFIIFKREFILYVMPKNYILILKNLKLNNINTKLFLDSLTLISSVRSIKILYYNDII